MARISTVKNWKQKRIPRILVIFPLIAAISYLLFLFNIITLIISSMIAFFSFILLAVLIILVDRKEIFLRKITKKHTLIIGIFLLICVIILVSLFIVLFNQSDQDNGNYKPDADKYSNKFIGSWKGVWTTITFSSDGSCSYEMYSGTWELKNGKLITYISSEYLPEEKITYDYSFSNNDKTLTLTDEDGGVNVYTKN